MKHVLILEGEWFGQTWYTHQETIELYEEATDSVVQYPLHLFYLNGRYYHVAYRNCETDWQEIGRLIKETKLTPIEY